MLGGLKQDLDFTVDDVCFVPLLCSKLCKSQRVGLCVEWRGFQLTLHVVA